MNRPILLFILILSALAVHGQILKPVTWSYAAKKTSKTEAVIYLKAAIAHGWHLYSQNVKEGGPVKTTFSFSTSGVYTLIGKTIEPKAITEYEEVFNIDVSYFVKSAMFTQKIKLNGTTATIRGRVEFMTCDAKQCLPPEEVSFSIPIK